MKINKTLKKHKGKIYKLPLINKNIDPNTFKLIASSSNTINQTQYNSMLISLKRNIPMGTKIIEKISLTHPVTLKTTETRMGKGKGFFSHFVTKIRCNQIILEIFVEETRINYKKFLKSAGMKLPIKSKTVLPFQKMKKL